MNFHESGIAEDLMLIHSRIAMSPGGTARLFTTLNQVLRNMQKGRQETKQDLPEAE